MLTARSWDGRSRRREPAPTLALGFDDDVPADPDPLRPHREHPTPLDLVLRLTAPQRLDRVRYLTDMAHQRYTDALAEHCADKTVTGVVTLVSGGNDSYTIAHLFRAHATHWMHANTQTGIEASRQNVRDTAAAWGIPLIEHTPPPGQGYFDLVRGTVMATSRTTGAYVQAWPGGFPGPAAHKVMYERLKDRSIQRIRHDLGIAGSTDHRAVLIAGRRRTESTVRATVPHCEPDGTHLWVSPIAVWHKADLRAYRLLHDDVPRNPVADQLGLSGECGCLANATPGEVELWRTAYPDDPFILAVAAMETELADRADIPEHRKTWGWGAYYDEPDKVTDAGRLCSTNCGPDPLWDSMDPLFELESL